MSVTTFKKSHRKRRRKHGFLKRMACRQGRKILNRRRTRKRKRIAVRGY